MKKFFILTLSTCSISSWASSNSNDFSESESRFSRIKPSELRSRFELHGEIFVSDAKGVLMHQEPQSRIWRFGNEGPLKSNWSYKSSSIPYVGLMHEWSIDKKGRIQAHIQQYDKIDRVRGSREVTYGNLLSEQSIEVKNFAPVVLTVHKDSEKTVVVRFTPRLDEAKQYAEIKGLPLTLRDPLVYDAQGNVWAHGMDLEGKFLALTTHKGQIAISFEPFKGAKEIGTVHKNEIQLKQSDGSNLFIRSEAPILTTLQPAKIYGIFDLSKKTDSIRSTGSSAADDEESFLKHL